MTTRKKKTDDIDPKDATGAQAEVIEETTTDDEVDGDVESPTFTITIDGKEIEVEDRWTRDAAPAGMMFVFHERYAQKYIPSVIESIIGEDQVFNLMEAGLSADEFQQVFQEWGKRRQGK